MEKPLERMLTLEKKIPYCFCWANEPWTRAWDGNTRDVIMPQEYGGETEWEQHFIYLLKFFNDEYYIKKENKPLLVIYRANSIDNYANMIEYFKKRSLEEGFSGLYVIEERNSFQATKFCSKSDAILDFEPMFTIRHGRTLWGRILDKGLAIIFNCLTTNNLYFYNYDRIWKRIIKRGKWKKNEVEEHYLGAFVDWDNTPRKGKNGLVIEGATPKKFEKYLSLQLKNAEEKGSEYIFVNAWNEWAEGTYLEADNKYGDDYLKAVKACMDDIREC